MKKGIMLTLLTFIFLVSSIAMVSSATVTPATPSGTGNQPITPPSFDPNQVILNKIDTEEKATRQFFSSEFQRQNAYYISEFTKRADYYENRFETLINEGVLKLGGLWAGIFIVASSITTLIHYWAEKRRYAMLKKTLKLDIVREIKKEYVMIPDKEIKFLNDFLVETKQIKKGEKVGFFKKLFSKKKIIVVTEPTKPEATMQVASEQKNEAVESVIDKMKRGKL